MAIYTTLFTATDDELTKYFGGWFAPLPKTVTIKRTNPFTGKTLTLKTQDPRLVNGSVELSELPDLTNRHRRKPLRPIVRPDGDKDQKEYLKGLERTAPALIRTFPHASMKAITEIELQQLGELLVGESAPPARFLNQSEDCSIGALQADAIPILAEATQKQLDELAEKWCETLVDFQPADALWVLLRIAPLAKDAMARNANLFSHSTM